MLREKIANANKLSKITKINRTTVYLELDKLLNRGLVNYVIKDSKRYYQAADPDKLMEILETRKVKLESILPKLKGLAQPVEPFKIEVYEGKEGLKTFYQDIMNSATEVLAFGVTGKAFEALEFMFPQFVKKYIKKGIKARYLANYDSKIVLKKCENKILAEGIFCRRYNHYLWQ